MLIERVIHSFWDGPPMPSFVKRSIESWEQHYPGWEIRVWNEKTLPRLRLQELYDNPTKYSPKSNPWQWKTNLARLELLHDQSGVWMDADLLALKNAEELFSGYTAFVARESEHFVNNGLVGCAPQHPFITELLEKAPARILDNPRWRSNKSCGPHHFTDVIQRHPDVGILERHHVYPSRWDELERGPEDFPDSYFFHWWQNKRSQLRGR